MRNKITTLTEQFQNKKSWKETNLIPQAYIYIFVLPLTHFPGLVQTLQ